MWQFFKLIDISLTLPLFEPISTQTQFFLQNLINFKFLFAKSLQGMSSKALSSSFSKILQWFKLGFQIFGIFFRKWVGVLILWKFFPFFDWDVIDLLCLFLCWSYVAVLACIKAYFSLCSCIFHHCCALLHVRCLIECPSDIFELNWIQVNFNF